MNQEHEADDAMAAQTASAEMDMSAGDDAPDADAALLELQSQIEALKNDVLRERAETENVRKRARRDVEAAHKYGLERLVQELLPVKDSMDMGLQAALGATEIEALTEGMALTAKMFDDFFGKLNVVAVEPVGERFDPEFHQAMTTEESREVEPGTVLSVMQKGYLLNDRLVRPALVIVARAPAPDDA